jgi:hypothetical protein
VGNELLNQIGYLVVVTCSGIAMAITVEKRLNFRTLFLAFPTEYLSE